MSESAANGYSHFILDLDGTVYLDGHPIGDVLDRLRRLSQRGARISVITNNTSLSTDQYYEKVRELGLPVQLGDIFSPIDVAGAALRSIYGENATGFILGTDAMRRQMERQYQIRHADYGASFVLVGFDKDLTYARLQRACELVNAGSPYYLTHIDLACPTRLGPIPDCGALGGVIRAATGRHEIDHFGKPGRWMADHVRRHVDLTSGVLLAGDRLYTDIALGHEIGVDTLLVLSGESKRESLDAWADRPPTHVAESLAEFLACHSTTR
jgi:HAD superfamily hydrolase (TIGR01450 family)